MELEEAIKHWKNNLDKWKKDRPDLSNTEIVEEIDYDYNAIETVLNHITKQEKMIDLMAEELAFGVFDFKSKEQVKQYFEKKAEENK